MYNLYQSKLRKDIQTKVYHKPHFDIDLFGKKYFWLIKEKKIWPIRLKRYQIMWVELPKDKEYIQLELKRIKSKYKKEKWAMFMQLCMIDEIINFQNISTRPDDFIYDIKKMRLDIRNSMKSKYWLNIAFRENMPQSNIIIDVTKQDDILLWEMFSQSRRKVKKAIKSGLEFDTLKPEQYDEFYDKWLATSGKKWFNIISRKQYNELIKYLIDNKKWEVLVVSKDGGIVSGSICLFQWEYGVYLYGFADRKFSNIWWHHFLKYKMFGYLRDNWYKYLDFLWWAPTWFPDHSLVWVSKFKESLWWIKTEQYGSYDLIINPLLYKIFKRYYKLRK